MSRSLDTFSDPETVIVEQIEGGWHIRQRLNQMGIHPGDVLTVKQRGRFHGPLLVEVHGVQVALGRGMARHVVVSAYEKNQI